MVSGPELFDIVIELKEGKNTINAKIEEACKSLRDTSNLISEIEKDLNERTEKVRELKEIYEEYSKLTEIEEDKIQPLLNQFEKNNRKKEKF